VHVALFVGWLGIWRRPESAGAFLAKAKRFSSITSGLPITVSLIFFTALWQNYIHSNLS
jgi:hypothetical protein